MMMTSCLAANERSRRFWSPLITTAAMSAAFALAPNVAHADEATAEALFKAGKSLMDQKKYAEACPKLEASYKLDPGIGTKLNLADCHEKEGKLAQAWGEWGEGRDQAKRENDKPRTELAIRRQKELEPKVPKLTVNVTGPATGIAVYRDELQLDTAMLGVPLPVDPGAHIVTLRRGKSVLREKKVDVAEASTGEVTIDATGIPAATPAEQTANVTDPNKKPKVIMVRKSKGMIAGGVIIATFSSFLVIGGIAGFAVGEPKVGIPLFLIGGGGMAGGIIMANKGLEKVPKETHGFMVTPPRLFIGPGSIGITGTF